MRHYFRSADGKVEGSISLSNIYRYHGVTFEWHAYVGPMLCNKNLEPSKREIGRKTNRIISKWCKLTPSKKERTMVYG